MISAMFAAALAALIGAAPAFAQQPAPATPQDKEAHSGEAVPTVQDPVTAKRAVELESQLRCLVCQNQTIADSNADLAADLRAQVREQIAQGRTDREIKDYMVARYGDFVLYRPPLKATTILLWSGPALLFLAGLFMLVRTLRRRKIEGEPRPLSAEDRRQAARLLDAQDGATK